METNSIRSKPVDTVVSAAKKRKLKKLPPGQRLLVCLALASAVIGLRAQSIPAGVPLPEAKIATAMVPATPPFELKRRLDEIEKSLDEVTQKPKLETGIFAVEPSTGRFIDVHGEKAYPAASMIKVPVLVALLRAMDNKTVQPEQLLIIRPDLIAGGSGFLQWRKPGTKVSVKETAELMIIFSDNTATNMIIDLLGGKEALNKQFHEWGLQQTDIRNLLADFDGTNTTSPYDLTYLLGKIDCGELISPQSREFMYNIMYKTTVRTLLPPGLGPGAKIAHKTGDIGGMVGDSGIVTAADGKRYIVTVQVARPHNDHRANELIRDISRIVYSAMVDDKLPAPAPRVEPKKQTASGAVRHHHRHHRSHR